MFIENYCNVKGNEIELKFSLESFTFHRIVTCNPEMLKQIERINKISATMPSAVIFGETGTGKELYAEYIHWTSDRRAENYTKVNCATIPEKLFESEMFGYEPGAFTGALKTGKIGFFEIANKGTLFLDEISEMPCSLQSKLLRVLQENKFLKVGGNKELSTDVRIIAASNKELSELVKEGGFRKDLFYRLNVIPIKLLPLRERKEDIIVLSFYFLNYFNKIYHTEKKISYKLMDAFLAYDWPGNVRELRNNMERLILLSDEDLLENYGILETTMEDSNQSDNGKHDAERDAPVILRAIEDFDNGKTLKELVAEYELLIIREYIEKTGSLRKAAKALGTSPSVLSRKLNPKENE